MPFYVIAEKRPKIPASEKIDMLISASCMNLACKLGISKETGLRPIEVANLIKSSMHTFSRLQDI